MRRLEFWTVSAGLASHTRAIRLWFRRSVVGS